MVLKQFTQCEGPRAIMHTNMGDITIQLYPEVAPKTVENFVSLSEQVISRYVAVLLPSVQVAPPWCWWMV